MTNLTKIQIAELSPAQRVRYYQTQINKNTELAINNLSTRFIASGRVLPATGLQVCEYLVSLDNLNIRTLKNYAALFVSMHYELGYEQMAASIQRETRSLLRGMSIDNVKQRRSARPLLIEEFSQINNYLEEALSNGHRNRLRTLFDIALIRIAYWSGRRESELVSLTKETCTLIDDKGDRHIDFFWGSSKGDRNRAGVSFQLPSVPIADPWVGLQDWLDVSSTESNFIFCIPTKSGKVRTNPMHPNSFPRWLRDLAKESGINPEGLSGHSCRRGLAVKLGKEKTLPELMSYFNWKNEKTALDYATDKTSQDIHATLIKYSRSIGKLN